MRAAIKADASINVSLNVPAVCRRMKCGVYGSALMLSARAAFLTCLSTQPDTSSAYNLRARDAFRSPRRLMGFRAMKALEISLSGGE